jgi:hypothetical protein
VERVACNKRLLNMHHFDVQAYVGWNLQLLHMLSLTRSEVQLFIQAAAELRQLGKDVSPLQHTCVLVTSTCAAPGVLPQLCMIASCSYTAGEPPHA